MTTTDAIILGLVQGFAEFLPISSSGHLVLAQTLLGMCGESDLFFEVLLHVGTLFAVFAAFFGDIIQLIRESFGLLGEAFSSVFWRRGGSLLKGGSKRDWLRSAGKSTRGNRPETPYKNYLLRLMTALLPLFLVLPFKGGIESLFGKPALVGAALIATSFVLAVSGRILEGNKYMDDITARDSLIVGFTQLVAVIPGLSRSGTTITAGLAAGFTRELAVSFSFMLSIPTIIAAAALTFYDVWKASAIPTDLFPYIIGMGAAFLSGLISIWLVKILVKNNSFKWFGAYCFVVGAAAVVLSFF